MRSRHHPLPRRWLITDERLGDTLWGALAALPRGSGIVFRHYGTPYPERRALFERVQRIARRKGLVLVLAGDPARARAWGANGVHCRGGKATPPGLLRTVPVHDARELARALRVGADAVFVSPVFPTRSHPGARSLGPVRFGLIASRSKIPVIALGGMDATRAHALRAFGIYGWAAIDAWTR